MSDGVVITMPTNSDTKLKLLRLQVVNDKIIHVSATSNKELSKEKSLIAVAPVDNQSTWNLASNKDSVFLSTAELKAAVSLYSGEIRYYNKFGNLILGESEGVGKTFAPTTIDGTKGYTIHQKFNSTDDEAFYGLGQHQSDEFNYKGKMKSYSNIIQKYLYLSLCLIRTMAFCGIITLSLNLEISMITNK
jgi:hypothetical protein